MSSNVVVRLTDTRKFSPLQLRGKLSVTSRKSCAMSPWTSNRRWPPPPQPLLSRNPTNCLMAKWSPSATKGSGAQKPYSSHLSWVWNLAASTRPPSIPSWNATLISVRISTPTLYSLVSNDYPFLKTSQSDNLTFTKSQKMVFKNWIWITSVLDKLYRIFIDVYFTYNLIDS